MGGPEIDILAVDAAASESAHSLRHVAPPGSPCRNCGATLQGPWCHACGQKADDFHRSIWRLAAEAFEGLTDFDSRIWRTLVRLVRDPGGLTRDYVEGHRASELPPFRLFLVMVVIVFLAGGLAVRGVKHTPEVAANGQRPAEVHVGPDTNFRFSVAKPGAARRAVTLNEKQNQAFESAVDRWAHQFALLSVLVVAPIVALLFRRRYFFDHLIFSLHSLSFQGTVFMLALAVRATGVPRSDLVFLAIPVHVFFHLRGAYRLTNWGAVWRTGVMLFGEAVGFILLMIGLILVSLAAAR